MSARTRLRLTMLLGAVLSVPIVRMAMNRSIPIDAAAIRIFVAMAFALIAVSGIGYLLQLYTPAPSEAEPDSDAGIEDAELVSDANPTDF